MAENSAVKNKKGRKWVISGMCIFLVVLALMTFFSNTIMNATIPKVMATYANRGNLSYTNNSTGVITADTKYEIKGIDGRVVDEVRVNNYETVTEGQVLFTLEPVTDMSALESLQTELTSLEREAEYESRRPSSADDYTSYQEAIRQAELTLQEANATLNDSRNRDSIIATNQATINRVGATIPGLESTLNAETAMVSDISAQISALESAKSLIENQINTLVIVGVPTPTPMPEDYVYIYDPAQPTPTPAPQQTTERIGQLQEEILAIDAQIEQLQEQLDDATARVNTASENLAAAQAEYNAAEANLEAANSLPSVSDAQASVTLASSALTTARRSLSDAQINAGISADQAQDTINDRNRQMEQLRTKIEEMQASLEMTEVVATHDGFIYNLSVSHGDTLSKESVVTQIIPEGSTYSVNFTFDANVTQDFYIGMDFSTDAYNIDACKVVNIRPDETNPQNKRIVKCALEGYYIWPGQSITVTADRSNANYDHVIPSSAVNEDNSGSFVYIIVESSSPLGKKYVVKRISVTVEATSGGYAAISGDNIDNNQIITRSEKPLNDGDRVRLEDFTNN